MEKGIYKIDIDFKLIFNEWTHYLNILLTSGYMRKLMVFLNESYKYKNMFPVDKKLIFKPFQEVNFYDVRVVIIGKEPYNNDTNTGIPFAQKDDVFGPLEDGVYQIERSIEETQYDGYRLNMDVTLERWTRQGILPLYSALTMQKNKVGSHTMHWRNFIREVVNAINNNRTGIIYCLWGKDAQYFKQFINEKSNYVLECTNPQDYRKIEKWKCDHFKEINKIIEENNGSDNCIEW